MRRILLLALVAAPLAALAPAASAVCDPDFEPLCLNECVTRLPDANDPLAYLTRVCPR